MANSCCSVLGSRLAVLGFFSRKPKTENRKPNYERLCEITNNSRGHVIYVGRENVNIAKTGDMKILFVNPFGIGDVLFTTPLMKPLRERGDAISYWCNERVVDILAHNKAIKRVYPLSRGDLKRYFRSSPVTAAKKLLGLAGDIRRERFDIALDFSLDYRYSLFLRLLGLKRVIGFDYKGRGRFLTDKIGIDGFDGRHMVEHYGQLLRFIDSGIKVQGKMELYAGADDEKWRDGFLGRRGIKDDDVLVGMAPGGGLSWGDSAFRKQWPKENFAYIGDELIRAGNYKIVIFGSEEESDICDYIDSRIKKNVINLCGRTGLGRFAAVLKRCRLLITNDGGPLHMASALGVRTVSIFGPVDEKVYGPYPPSDKHGTVAGDAECRPCYKNFRYEKCADRKCLDNIEPVKVLEAVRSKLG